jgi:branched-chain amino acid transport system ATP-binding protein
LLQLNNLEAYYGKTQVIKGLSLTVENRKIVTLIGANGAGKTTVLKLISGLVRPKSGTVELDGKRIDRLSTTEIVKLGISRIPQGRCIFPHMTIMENLLLGSYVLKDKAKVNEQLDMVFQHFPLLKERSKNSAGNLSGGQQQMLAVGRGLMADPKVLLLDEPSLGLAPQLVMEIARIIIEIFKKGVDILLVEQNARMALNLCHYAYVMETGKITLEGPGKELVNNKEVISAYLGGRKVENQTTVNL